MHFNAKKCFAMRITHSRNPKLFDYSLVKKSWSLLTAIPILELTSLTPFPGTSTLIVSLRLLIGP
ncbi:hypothetical protein HOLleu_05102 [Holothuria leucospilota]|uniref:Uncharacterized protein n=1 Tax=Holothuria leucospilota TaxID=206669 RepID=A0A9Q1CKI6_HOLLE|nr:hypothetical protein HOLleu_05102 [Holothuria leucospilota]